MLWIDLETYNEVKDIKAGVYEYARTCEILLVAYAFGNDPVQLWDRTQEPMPLDLEEAFANPDTKYTAHNAQFDRIVLRDSGLFGGYVGNPHNWDCTMVKAMLHGFTGSLDKLGDIFGLGSDDAKIKEGKKLINRFCKPAPKNHKADRYTVETHPEEWQRFCDYAVRDVAAMRKIARKIPNWNWCPDEYHLDQVINDRGFQVDVDLVKAGAKAAAQEKIALAERFVELTKGEVSSPTQRAKFLEYLNDQFNLELENTQKATLEPLLKNNDLDVRARALIGIALAANKTSTAKYKTLEPAVSPDERFRGGLQFSGAQRTRRWAGRTFQPQNLPSKGIPKSHSIEIYIEALKAGVHDILFADELMKYGSAALRGVLIAPKGKKNCVSDLSNIEGRANAWLADEEWKLQAFRDFDTFKLDRTGALIPDGKGGFVRLGPDLYKVAAGKILGKTPQAIIDAERNSFGKVTELALGYQGGVGAIQNFATAMGVAFADHWGAIQQSVDQGVINQAYDNWESWGKEKAQDTPQDEWIASEVVKLSWRASHPQIVKLWHACEDAARSALNNPGQVFKAGKHLHFKYVRYAGHNYLLMRLPSDKFLIYFEPKQNDEGKISYWGVDSITKQWSRQHIYGGKFVENACQSLSRDILMQGIFSAEEEGYKPVLTVHDELVTECPDTDDFTHEGLSRILSTPLNWCPGFPLAAEGFEAYRYRK